MNLKMYPYAMAAFVAATLLANVLAVKVFQLGPFTLTSGVLIFPVSYILGDVLTEVYGYRRAQRIILAGVAANIAASGLFAAAVRLPGIDPEVSRAFALVLDQVPRIVLGSIVGFWTGQHANSAVLSIMKILTRGRWLWTRTVTSTLVGEGVDTALFVTIGFAGTLPLEVLVTIIWSATLIKTAYEFAATPITYAVINWWKRVERLDTFDYGEDYNPLLLGGRR